MRRVPVGQKPWEQADARARAGWEPAAVIDRRKNAPEAPKSAAAHGAAAFRRQAAGGAFFRPVDRVSRGRHSLHEDGYTSGTTRLRHSTTGSALLKQPEKQ